MFTESFRAFSTNSSWLSIFGWENFCLKCVGESTEKGRRQSQAFRRKIYLFKLKSVPSRSHFESQCKLKAESLDKCTLHQKKERVAAPRSTIDSELLTRLRSSWILLRLLKYDAELLLNAFVIFLLTRQLSMLLRRWQSNRISIARLNSNKYCSLIIQISLINCLCRNKQKQVWRLL